MIPALELTQLGKSYDTDRGRSLIVKDFNLRVSEGEFVCIIGHSGCGKSTVLSIAMGLNDATEGGVIIAGREVIGPGLDRGVVFQSSALLPWLTARENVLLAVEQCSERYSRRIRRGLADKYLFAVGLDGVGDSYPEELSAGMRQRVGIARALALEPKVLLLDEPFSLLDVVTRMELQDQVIRLCAQEKKTVLMVTHDVDEALLLADRIVMMTNGPAATVGEVLGVPFERPRDRLSISEDPMYHRLRGQMLRFLEERAPERAVSPLRERGAPSAQTAQLTVEELFIIEKYTGFNRFRGRYRHRDAAVQVLASSAPAEAKALG
ncbi:MAG TPA: ABC transporter ATP-binding protein [Candidatus Binatia bacterium]